MANNIISEKEYDDLIAKLLVEGLTEEEREKIDNFQKALIEGKAKKTEPTDKRKKIYEEELKRRMGKDYDKKVLNESDPRYKEGLTITPNGKLKLGDKVVGEFKGVGKIVNITEDFVRIRDNEGKFHIFDEDELKKYNEKFSKKEKLNCDLEKLKEKYNFKSKKEMVTPAFQKELFRILRNHYPHATAENMEKVLKFIDKVCNKTL